MTAHPRPLSPFARPTSCFPCDEIIRSGLSDRLRAIHGDFLKTPLPKTDALVANVPYQISSPLVRRLFSLHPDIAPSRSVLLLQKEFADRMVAQ